MLCYRLLRNVGATRATSVTYLNPPVAMIAGALYLGEPITPQMIAAVILVGTALALGVGGRREPRSIQPANLANLGSGS